MASSVTWSHFSNTKDLRLGHLLAIVLIPSSERNFKFDRSTAESDKIELTLQRGILVGTKRLNSFIIDCTAPGNVQILEFLGKLSDALE